MKISEILQSKNVTVSLEVFPPKKQDAFDGVVKAAKELAAMNPDFMSITYGANGSTRVNTAEISAEIEKCGVSALSHLTCIGAAADGIENAIERLKGFGIENVLALRGDIPEGMSKEEATGAYPHASDIVPLLKDAGFCVGGACYPEGHPESPNRIADIDNLKRKVDAGVDFLTTQMFFDNDMLYSFLYQLQSRGIHVPVIAGIMPITSASQVQRMVKLSDAFIPRKLLAICDRFQDDNAAMHQAGIAYAIDQIIDLVSNGVRGIHIYTLNKSDAAREILNSTSAIFAAINNAEQQK